MDRKKRVTARSQRGGMDIKRGDKPQRRPPKHPLPRSKNLTPGYCVGTQLTGKMLQHK